METSQFYETNDDSDPFDSLLSLENDFFEDGYREGYADGVQHARLEAHVFGIEQGFAKFIAMGKLHARAVVWQAQIKSEDLKGDSSEPSQQLDNRIPRFSHRNPRLAKHIETLLALTEPATLSTENTDTAVAEFDDRFKRAQAKEKVIERLLSKETSREAAHETESLGSNHAQSTDIESFGNG